MPTFTFDRPIVITREDDRKRLEEVMNKPGGRKVNKDYQAEIQKGEELLKKHYFHTESVKD